MRSILFLFLVLTPVSSFANSIYVCINTTIEKKLNTSYSYEALSKCDKEHPLELSDLLVDENISTDGKKSIISYYSASGNSHSFLTYGYFRSQFNELNSYEWFINSFEEQGNYLSNSVDRENIGIILKWASSYIYKEDYPYIKKWFTTAIENDPYETLIVLRRIYKEDMYFHDKNVEKYLKNLYQEAL